MSLVYPLTNGLSSNVSVYQGAEKASIFCFMAASLPANSKSQTIHDIYVKMDNINVALQYVRSVENLTKGEHDVCK